MEALPGREPPEVSRRVRADALDRADMAWRARVAGGTWEQCPQVAGGGIVAGQRPGLVALGRCAEPGLQRFYDPFPDVQHFANVLTA